MANQTEHTCENKEREREREGGREVLYGTKRGEKE